VKPAVVTKIDETTWRFSEKPLGEAVYMYLLVGTKRALLIDTGYGLTDVPTAIQEITSLPLTVVNTHGHMDHVHGNHFYSEVYLSEKDEECFRRHTDKTYLMGLLKDVLKQAHLPLFLLWLPGLHSLAQKVATAYPSKHKPLPKEMYVELGDRRVTILETPGHTIGSVSLLDEKKGWLFSGDTTCQAGVLLHFPESTDVVTFRETIRSLKALADQGRIQTIYPCHQETPLGTEILDAYLKTCDALIERQNEITGTRFKLDDGPAIQFDKKKIGGTAL